MRTTLSSRRFLQRGHQGPKELKLASAALKLLREMERKYVRVIETMKGSELVMRPPERVLRSLEEDLERTRQKIRELEAAEARAARTQSTTTRGRKRAPR
jgi:hypothetical protein